MKAILEFNLPEENIEYQDYLDGVKCKYLLHSWLQDIGRKLKNYPKTTGVEVYKDLQSALDDNNIRIFN